MLLWSVAGDVASNGHKAVPSYIVYLSICIWVCCLSSQVEQIDKVFSSACKQKAWDHFTKAQRKNIELWRKQAEVRLDVHTAHFLINKLMYINLSSMI